MKLKSALKVVLLSVALTILVCGGLLMWGLSKLPSAFEIKQSVTPPALQTKVVNQMRPNSALEINESPQGTLGDSHSLPEKQVADLENERLVQETTKVLTEDFMDTRKPLVESCRNLGLAKDSHLLRDKKSASAKYFFQSLAQEQKDPLVETAAPVLRYVFRAPGMQNVMSMVLQAQENKDLGLLKKAEFYYEIYQAGQYLQNHRTTLDMILQKSYNLHHLAKAVAVKPELAQDGATLNFCEQMEKNLNSDSEYDANLASQEMMNFLKDAGIEPKDIGYDPKYRSKVKMNLGSSQVSLNDTWMVQLFARDIEKAHQRKVSN